MWALVRRFLKRWLDFPSLGLKDIGKHVSSSGCRYHVSEGVALCIRRCGIVYWKVWHCVSEDHHLHFFLRIQVFGNVTCCWVGGFSCFRGMWCLRLQGREVKRFIEDIGITFLHNVQNHVPSDTPAYPRPRGPESLATPF